MSRVRSNFSYSAYCFAFRQLFPSVITFTLLILSLSINTASAIDNLGLRIDVLPNEKASKSEPYSQNRRLWLVTSEPTTTSRTIKITSSVNNSQLITLDISGARRIGEVTQIDVDNESDIKPWTTFSDSSFILPAYGQKNVQIMITPPENLKDYSQDAFLIVKSALTSAPKIDKNRTVGILNSVFQYATPLFYGIGNIKNLVSIQIKDIKTYIDENGKYAEIEILNNGVGPVEISGDAQFTNLEFQTDNVGPLQYSLPPLLPGERGYGTIRLPETMVPGKWKIFIQAYAGSYGEAVVITKNLTFDYKQNSQLPRVILFIASLLLLIALLSLQTRLRKKIHSAPEVELEKIKGEYRLASVFKAFRRFPKLRNKFSDSGTLIDLEVQAWLDKISSNARKNNQKSNSTQPRSISKKKVEKKAPAKKTVAKKTIKKVPTKKNSLYKALPKKKTAKKVAVKKR
jgi:hypothetical protein